MELKIQVSEINKFISAKVNTVLWNSKEVGTALLMPCHCKDCTCCHVKKAVYDKFGSRNVITDNNGYAKTIKGVN